MATLALSYAHAVLFHGQSGKFLRDGHSTPLLLKQCFLVQVFFTVFYPKALCASQPQLRLRKAVSLFEQSMCRRETAALQKPLLHQTGVTVLQSKNEELLAKLKYPWLGQARQEPLDD